MLIYEALAVSIAGKFVVQQTQVTVEYIDSDTAVSFLGGGAELTMAIIPGGRMMRVSFEMAVPSEDSSDFTFIEQYANCSEVKLGITLRGNGAQASAIGFLQRPRLTSAYGSNLVYAIDWIGPQAIFR